MGTQMRRMAELEQLGVPDEEVQLKIDELEGLLESAGDTWSEIIWAWNEKAHSIVNAREELPIGDPLPVDLHEDFIRAGIEHVAKQLATLTQLKGLYAKHVRP